MSMFMFIFICVFISICIIIFTFLSVSERLVTTAVFCLWHPPAGIVGVSALQKHPGPPARRASSWRQKASPNQTPWLDWWPLSSNQQRLKFKDIRDMCQTSMTSETCVKPRNICETWRTRTSGFCTWMREFYRLVIWEECANNIRIVRCDNPYAADHGPSNCTNAPASCGR